MARAPRASISKTSGQGISRGIYKTGRRLAGKDSGNVPKVNTSFAGSSPSSGRDYTKGSSSSTTTVPPMNVSYGDTISPTNLADVQGEFPQRPPRNAPKGPGLGMKASKVLK